MRTKFVALSAVVALGLGFLMAGSASAQGAQGFSQVSDYRTYFTFSGPVAVPGVTLPAGKYLFRLANPSESRNTIQVLSADGTTPYAMFFFHRVERPEASEAPEIRFMETAAGMPRAVRTWWYSNERSGYEFVYPREQALRLAKGSGEPVLTATTSAAAAATPPLSVATPAGKIAPVPEAAIATTGPTLKGEAAPASVAVAPALEARAQLPRTASSAPVVTLFGVVLLMGAVAIRVWRNGIA